MRAAVRNRRIATLDLQRQVGSPIIAAMAALASWNTASAAAALEDDAVLALGNVAATTMERRTEALAPMDPGYAPLAREPHAVGANWPESYYVHSTNGCRRFVEGG